MNNTLILGNGFNRCYRQALSWEELTRVLANEAGTECVDQVPFPIEFERIASIYMQKLNLDRSTAYSNLKNIIADQLSDEHLKPGRLHFRLAKIGIDNIITTNYDCCVETAFNATYDQLNSNVKYITQPVASKDQLRIYHAHGVVRRPKSICLGHEHYMGNVQKIRGALLGVDDVEQRSALCRKINTHELKSSWPELFLSSNIYMVGFGCDFSETDFWWLLSLWASLRGQGGVEPKKRNQIRYYHVRLKNDCESYSSQPIQNRVLDGLGVLVQTVTGNSYEEAYEKIMNQIESLCNSPCRKDA